MAENAHVRSLGLKHSPRRGVLDRVHFLRGSSGRHLLLEVTLALFQHDFCSHLPSSAFLGEYHYLPEELSLPGESARRVGVQMGREVMTHAVPPLGLGSQLAMSWCFTPNPFSAGKEPSGFSLIFGGMMCHGCSMDGKGLGAVPEESIFPWRAVIF